MAFGEAARVTSWTSVPLNAQRRLRITKGRPKAAQLARVPLRYLVLILAHLLDGDPVLSFGRNIKFLSRYLYGFVCIGGLDGPKVLPLWMILTRQRGITSLPKLGEPKAQTR